MSKKEYYYNYDILCHEYCMGGVVSTDNEAYATSYKQLCKDVRDSFESEYDYSLEDIEEYGQIEIQVNSTNDPKFKGSSVYYDDSKEKKPMLYCVADDNRQNVQYQGFDAEEAQRVFREVCNRDGVGKWSIWGIDC